MFEEGMNISYIRTVLITVHCCPVWTNRLRCWTSIYGLLIWGYQIKKETTTSLLRDLQINIYYKECYSIVLPFYLPPTWKKLNTCSSRCYRVNILDPWLRQHLSLMMLNSVYYVQNVRKSSTKCKYKRFYRVTHVPISVNGWRKGLLSIFFILWQFWVIFYIGDLGYIFHNFWVVKTFSWINKLI